MAGIQEEERYYSSGYALLRCLLVQLCEGNVSQAHWRAAKPFRDAYGVLTLALRLLSTFLNALALGPCRFVLAHFQA